MQFATIFLLICQMQSRFEDDVNTYSMATIRAGSWYVTITYCADLFFNTLDNFDIAHA